jgi:hypothetical protein
MCYLIFNLHCACGAYLSRVPRLAISGEQTKDARSTRQITTSNKKPNIINANCAPWVGRLSECVALDWTEPEAHNCDAVIA